MELMQASLQDVIYEPSFVPYATWDSGYLCIAMDVAKGMAFIHANDLLHRDLKPGNVLLDAHWVAKVADFGCAIDDSKYLYEAQSQIAGTPPYMAPEIITARTYQPPVDVWAFGCVALHGREPSPLAVARPHPPPPAAAALVSAAPAALLTGPPRVELS